MTSHCTHIVFYHGRCPDGLGAAWAARQVLGDTAEYIPMEYGISPKDASGKHVVILDYSFSPMVLKIMEDQAESILLLDHHSSAQEMLSGYQCQCHTNLQFDMKRSGAMMAWQHYHPEKEPPALIKFIQDRDLWNWSFEDSKAFLRHLDALPLTFETFDTIGSFNEEQLKQFIATGYGLVQQFDILAQTFIDIAQPLNIDGYAAFMTSTTGLFCSEVGSVLARKENSGIGVMWYVENPTTVKVSLRSIDSINVKDIALRWGGGGHNQASAFRMPIERLPELVSGKLWSDAYKAQMQTEQSISVLGGTHA